MAKISSIGCVKYIFIVKERSVLLIVFVVLLPFKTKQIKHQEILRTNNKPYQTAEARKNHNILPYEEDVQHQ